VTPTQYERWVDFATRAAKTWYATSRRPSAAWVLDVVEDFFDGLPRDEIPLIVHWDHSRPYPGRSNFMGRDIRPMCLGDQITEYLWSELASWGLLVRLDDDTDPYDDAYCERLERAGQQWDDQWGGSVRCCLRAGLDMAASLSGGVLGFTAGDIRKMYPEGVPEWVFPRDKKLMRGMLDPVENGTFAELPDDAPLCL